LESYPPFLQGEIWGCYPQRKLSGRYRECCVFCSIRQEPFHGQILWPWISLEQARKGGTRSAYSPDPSEKSLNLLTVGTICSGVISEGIQDRRQREFPFSFQAHGGPHVSL
jgi:hypothetical protein